MVKQQKSAPKMKMTIKLLFMYCLSFDVGHPGLLIGKKNPTHFVKTHPKYMLINSNDSVVTDLNKTLV